MSESMGPSSERSVFMPIWAILAVAAGVSLLGQFLRYFATTASGSLGGGIALLLPWILMLGAAMLMAVSHGPIRLALLAGSGSVALAFALPLVLDRLPGIGVPDAVWTSGRYAPWIDEIFRGESTLLRAANWIMAAGMLLFLAFVVTAVIRLRSLLLGPALRSGFGIDMTVLLTLFTVAALLIGRAGPGGAWLDALTSPETSGTAFALEVRTYSWVLPLALWLALLARQGGALAVGASAGLVLTFLLLPPLIDLAGNSIGTLTPIYSQAGDQQAPFTTFDWTGPKPALGWIAVALFTVSLWWALGTQSSGNRAPHVTASGARVNPLSIVAFTLSWFPITAIPGIVLGHMAYDQIVDTEDPQRGIGLARWSIILGYISIVAAAVLFYNTYLGR